MYKQYINGQLVEGKGQEVEITNPATGKVIATYKAATVEQAQEALEAAQKAFQTWSKTSLNERTKWVMKLHAAMMEHKEELIDLVAIESGRSYSSNIADFNRSEEYFNFYCEEVRRVYDVGVTEGGTTNRDSFHVIVKRPVGVVVGHLAWNVPLINFGAKAAPALASGCTAVLKPSTSTPLTAMRLGELAAEIGFPAGILNVISGPSSVIGKYLNESTIPALVTCIGSTATGRQLVAQSSTSIKHLSLELGGNAPAIIFPDADLDSAAEFIATRKVANTGQGCGTINRIFVHKDVHDAFVEKLIARVSQMKCGWDKKNPAYVGSLIDKKERQRLLDLIDDSVKRGAKLVYGGTVPDYLPEELQDGAFLIPGILDGVTDDMPVAYDEIFGPIYGVLTFEELDDVIERANSTPYGLTSYLYTKDAHVMMRCAEDLDIGKVLINNVSTADPNLPHAGHKQSGVGCVFSKWALDDYYTIKLVAAKL